MCAKLNIDQATLASRSYLHILIYYQKYNTVGGQVKALACLFSISCHYSRRKSCFVGNETILSERVMVGVELELRVPQQIFKLLEHMNNSETFFLYWHTFMYGLVRQVIYPDKLMNSACNAMECL
jgi:hypothetical protein